MAGTMERYPLVDTRTANPRLQFATHRIRIMKIAKHALTIAATLTHKRHRLRTNIQILLLARFLLPEYQTHKRTLTLHITPTQAHYITAPQTR